MTEEKLNAITDNVFKIILEKGASGKMSDFTSGFNEVKDIIKKNLSTEYNRGYQTAKNEKHIDLLLKLKKEN